MTLILEAPPLIDLIVRWIAVTISWILGTVVFRYLFLPWLARYIVKKIKYDFEPTDRDRIIIRHYAYRRRGHIHQSLWPWKCNDGMCNSL